MQFGIEFIENFLATMVLEKEKTLWRDTSLEKHLFLFSLFTWELTKQILVWNYPKEDLFN